MEIYLEIKVLHIEVQVLLVSLWQTGGEAMSE